MTYQLQLAMTTHLEPVTACHDDTFTNSYSLLRWHLYNQLQLATMTPLQPVPACHGDTFTNSSSLPWWHLYKQLQLAMMTPLRALTICLTNTFITSFYFSKWHVWARCHDEDVTLTARCNGLTMEPKSSWVNNSRAPTSSIWKTETHSYVCFTNSSWERAPPTVFDATTNLTVIVIKYTNSTVLYCTVLYCSVLYCTVLYCTVLYCTVLYCTVLYCTVLYCNNLLLFSIK